MLRLALDDGLGPARTWRLEAPETSGLLFRDRPRSSGRHCSRACVDAPSHRLLGSWTCSVCACGLVADTRLR